MSISWHARRAIFYGGSAVTRRPAAWAESSSRRTQHRRRRSSCEVRTSFMPFTSMHVHSGWISRIRTGPGAPQASPRYRAVNADLPLGPVEPE